MTASFKHDPHFQKLLDGRPDVDLVELMLEFASDAYPNLDRRASRAEVDSLVEMTRAGLAEIPSGGVVDQLETVSETLFGMAGFRGNVDGYYEPDNSYLNRVLERRLGIPLSLSVLYMTVANRAGLKTFGVSAPAHFLVGCRSGRRVWYVDAFHGGEVLDSRAARKLIKSLLDRGDRLSRDDFLPATPLEIAMRTLRNLKTAYVMQDAWAPALPVQQRLSMLLPDRPGEQRDLGLVYLRLCRPQPALRLLEAYRAGCGTQEAAALEPFIRTARRMQAEMN